MTCRPCAKQAERYGKHETDNGKCNGGQHVFLDNPAARTQPIS